jgi:hypothetical protein
VEDERSEAKEILLKYRTACAIKAENDLQAAHEELGTAERARQFDAMQEARKKIDKCDHKAFLDASATARVLEAQAAKVVKPILDRLIESFDDELTLCASQRETDLLAHCLPLYTDDMRNGVPLEIGTYGLTLFAPSYMRIARSLETCGRNLTATAPTLPRRSMQCSRSRR